MMAPDTASVVPMFVPLPSGEPLAQRGRIPVSALDGPGFGVALERTLPLEHPSRGSSS